MTAGLHWVRDHQPRVLCPCSAVSAAIKDVFNETRCCLEPAGAVAVAGAKAYLQRHGMQASPAD